MKRNNLGQVPECEMQTEGGKVKFVTGETMAQRTGQKDPKSYCNLAKVNMLYKVQKGQ